MKKVTYLYFGITLLLYNIQSSESPMIDSRQAGRNICPPNIAETHCTCEYKGRHLLVDCSGMGMSDPPHWIPPNTKRLDLSENPFSEIPPEALRNLELLEEIIFSNCQLKELHPELFRYNRKLKYIILNNNNLTHISTKLFEGLTYLRLVDLRNNPYFNQTYELKKMYPKVDFMVSVDLDTFTSTQNGTTEAFTEIVATTDWDTNSSGTWTSQNSPDNPLVSTREPPTSEPNTKVLTHADKPKIKHKSTTARPWYISFAIGAVVIVLLSLAVGIVGCWLKRKGQLYKQNRQETEKELIGADTRTITESVSYLLSPDHEDT